MMCFGFRYFDILAHVGAVCFLSAKSGLSFLLFNIITIISANTKSIGQGRFVT